MPRGSKDKYTDKQKRKAAHIEESYEQRGVGAEEAELRAREPRTLTWRRRRAQNLHAQCN